MNEWKTLQEWRESGPDNGTKMLVLTNDGDREVGWFDGGAQRWITTSGKIVTVVAWATLPPVPESLIERISMIATERKRLDELERSSL